MPYSVCLMKLNYKITNRIRPRNDSFCERNIAQFWDIVYEESTQVAFTWFQCVIDLFFDKCFQKRLFKMTYQNRYPWMTDEMRTRITTKNKLGYMVFLKPAIVYI